jgi:hypothetical protein
MREERASSLNAFKSGAYMKPRHALLATALLVVACTPVAPTPVVTPPILPSPTSTAAPTPSPAASVDCGPIADPKSCASAVQAALRLTTVPKSNVASIVIEPRRPSNGCPSGITCLIPTVVKLLNVAGSELDTILLGEDPNGVWSGYPIALDAGHVE